MPSAPSTAVGVGGQRHRAEYTVQRTVRHRAEGDGRLRRQGDRAEGDGRLLGEGDRAEHAVGGVVGHGGWRRGGAVVSDHAVSEAGSGEGGQGEGAGESGAEGGAGHGVVLLWYNCL